MTTESRPLADDASLEALPASTLRDLGLHLAAIGLTRASLERVSAAVREVHGMFRKPLRAFHLRARAEPSAWAARLLMFGDAVTEAEARGALGALFEPLRDARLVVETPEGWLGRVTLALVDDLYLFSDGTGRGGDAVMGPSDATIALAAAALAPRKPGRALDLGCGSGAAALLLARAFDLVIATDILPRALAFTRMNAAVNGVSRVETRLGSLFEPVAGDTFELVLSQPPFIARPPTAEGSVFMHGGSLGDELPLALLAGLPPHLAPGGRALLYVEWPLTGDDPAAARDPRQTLPRLREALSRAPAGAAPLDVLHLTPPAVHPDRHAAEHAANLHPVLDAAFDREVEDLLAHFERHRIRALQPAFTVLERPPASAPNGAPARPPITDALPITGRARAHLTPARIDRLLAARTVPRAGLLDRAVRLPAGTVLVEEQRGPGADVPSTLRARFADAALVDAVGMTHDMLALVSVLGDAATVREGIAQLAEANEVAPSAITDKILTAVDQALRQGVLELA